MAKAGLVVGLGLVAAAQAAPLAALPLLMEALALGTGRLGIAVAAGLLTTLALAPRAGALADRLRPSRTARCGLGTILAASALLCGYTALVLDGTLAAESAFAVLLATRVANGAGVAVLHPSAQAWLWAGAGDEEGTRLQGWASAAQNTGRFFGPICVAFAGGLGAAWTLAILGAVAASALLALALTPDPPPDTGRVSPPHAGPPQASPSRDIRRLLAALLALHMLGGGAQFLLGPLLMTRLDLDAPEAARQAGWLMALAGAAAVAGNSSARRVPGRRPAATGAALATAGAAAFALSGGVVSVAAGVAALAAGIGVAVPSAMAALMLRSASSARGLAAGRAAATQAAAYAAAAPAYGLLFSADPALAAAALVVPAAAAWLILMTPGRADLDERTGAAEPSGQTGRRPG